MFYIRITVCTASATLYLHLRHCICISDNVSASATLYLHLRHCQVLRTLTGLDAATGLAALLFKPSHFLNIIISLCGHIKSHIFVFFDRISYHARRNFHLRNFGNNNIGIFEFGKCWNFGSWSFINVNPVVFQNLLVVFPLMKSFDIISTNQEAEFLCWKFLAEICKGIYCIIWFWQVKLDVRNFKLCVISYCQINKMLTIAICK